MAKKEDLVKKEKKVEEDTDINDNYKEKDNDKKTGDIKEKEELKEEKTKKDKKKQKKIKGKKPVKFKKFYEKNSRIIIISIVIVTLLIFSVFGTKIYLLANFILGNDIVVKLNVDKEELTLVRGAEQNINLEASVTTNPFCTAECSYVFKDISYNQEINKEDFLLHPGLPFTKELTIKTDNYGSGKLLYRLSMECKSKNSFLCHTSEEPTKRNILITADYRPNEEDILLKQELSKKIYSSIDHLEDVKSSEIVLKEAIKRLNSSLLIDLNTLIIKDSVSENFKMLDNIVEHWQTQDLSKIKTLIDELNNKITESENLIKNSRDSLQNIVKPYNVLIEELSKLIRKFQILADYTRLNKDVKIDKAIGNFNSAIGYLNNIKDLDKKKSIIEELISDVESLPDVDEEDLDKVTLKKELELILYFDTLCKISGQCIEHETITEKSDKKFFDVDTVCKDIRKTSSNITINISNYPSDNIFWENVEIMIDNIKYNVAKGYKEDLDPNSTNYDTIMNFIENYNYQNTTSYNFSIDDALLYKLEKPEECEEIILNKPEFSIQKIVFDKNLSISLNITLPEPKEKCCVLGECYKCCEDDRCRYENYPIVFLHGHAFNKDTSAEYSLDAFNKIQRKLEDDGYLNAGSMSLYTVADSEGSAWAGLPVPLSIKASYYLDIFEEPENYVVVQTKSENIDTYAVRLRELIDTVKLKAGKDKIIIIAHSMGGLVSRRYMQIFGSHDVSRLIMIGTPNKGIVGNTAEYCNIIGEKLECRDMNSESLFLNKLNRENLPEIPIFNIIGTGCNMDGEDGDGVVLKENVMLEGVKSYIIKGKCEKLKFLHTEMLNIEKYPEVYTAIKKALDG